MHRATIHRAVFIAALFLWTAPARAQDVLPADWWSNQTGSQGVVEVVEDGQGELLRLGAATSGSLDGTLTLPGGPLIIRELLVGVRAPAAGAPPGERVRLFVGPGLARTFEDLAPGETRFDTVMLWALAGPSSELEVRFEFESATDDPALHYTVLRGAALKRGFNVQLGTVRCALAPNSVGPGVFLLAAGSASVSADDFRLVASGGPPAQAGQLFYGPAYQRAPFGQGYLCIAPGAVGLQRLRPVESFSGSGVIEHAVDLAGAPIPIEPGAAWQFQLWYRDPAGGGAGFNTSESLRVAFAP